MPITKDIINRLFPMANPDEKTIKELNELKIEYEANFQKILQSPDKKYRIIEKQLNRLNIKLQQKLRIYISFTKSEMKEFGKRARKISNMLEERAMARA